MAKANLRPVGPDEKPSRRVKSVSDAVAFGTRLDELEQARVIAARAIDDASTPAHALPRLLSQLNELSREYESLRRATEEEAVDGAVSGDEEFDQAAI